jgi:probable F420-dependent oxidoreductase
LTTSIAPDQAISCIEMGRPDLTTPRIGLHALGIGAGARRDVIDAVSRAAEDVGFSRLWAGEHVVMVDRPASTYPYNDDGTIPIPPDVDWLDPFGCLSFAAAATRTISLATGVLLLPEHNPVLVAKQAATLDVLSGGRFGLGVGIGWSREEFDALGVPFRGRAARAVEYVAAIRALWREDAASFEGEFVSFDSVRVYPKPPRARSMPVVFGGNSDPALTRAAIHGDGWYGFNLENAGEAGEYAADLRRRREKADLDPAGFDVAASIRDCDPGELGDLAGSGIDELVLVEEPPDDAAAAVDWIDGLARRWLPPRPNARTDQRPVEEVAAGELEAAEGI